MRYKCAIQHFYFLYSESCTEHFWFEYESSDHTDVQTSLAGSNLHHLLPELVPVSRVLDAVELLIVHVIVTTVTPDRQITEAQAHHMAWEKHNYFTTRKGVKEK